MMATPRSTSPLPADLEFASEFIPELMPEFMSEFIPEVVPDLTPDVRSELTPMIKPTASHTAPHMTALYEPVKISTINELEFSAVLANIKFTDTVVKGTDRVCVNFPATSARFGSLFNNVHNTASFTRYYARICNLEVSSKYFECDVGKVMYRMTKHTKHMASYKPRCSGIVQDMNTSFARVFDSYDEFNRSKDRYIDEYKIIVNEVIENRVSLKASIECKSGCVPDIDAFIKAVDFNYIYLDVQTLDARDNHHFTIRLGVRRYFDDTYGMDEMAYATILKNPDDTVLIESEDCIEYADFVYAKGILDRDVEFLLSSIIDGNGVRIIDSRMIITDRVGKCEAPKNEVMSENVLERILKSKKVLMYLGGPTDACN